MPYNRGIFDIKEFYTSISKELPGDNINFAKQHITINKEDLTIIQYEKISTLQPRNSMTREKYKPFFDVTMMGQKFVNWWAYFFKLSSEVNKNDIDLY